MHKGIIDFIDIYNDLMQEYVCHKLLKKCLKKYNIKKLFPDFNESNGTFHGY